MRQAADSEGLEGEKISRQMCLLRVPCIKGVKHTFHEAASTRAMQLNAKLIAGRTS